MKHRVKLIGLLLFLSVVASIIAASQPAALAQGENRAQAGQMAPSFSLQTLENATVSLGDYRGRVLVLDFFASWCHVCQDATPELRQLRDNFSPENLAMLSVESDPAVPIENVRSFKSEHGGDWPFAKAPNVADRYGVEGYPTILAVTPDGYVAFRSEGSVPPNVLSGIVADLLGAPRPPELPENRPENRSEATNVIIDVKVEPENAGGIVATNLRIKENGAPLFTYEARASPGYEFAGWGGEAVPEDRENSRTLEIVPAPGTEITANFAPVEGKAGRAPAGFFGAFGLASFALGAVIAGCLGVLGSYLFWGRKKVKSGE